MKEAFGADVAEIEKGWHKRLDAVVLRPGLFALLEDRDDPVGALKRSVEAKLSPAMLGPASEWKALDGAEVIAGDPAKWEGTGAAGAFVLSGEKSQGDWSVARISVEPLDDAIVRCRAQATRLFRSPDPARPGMPGHGAPRPGRFPLSRR